MRALALALVVLASGCVSSASFPSQAAKTACERQSECAGSDNAIDLPSCEATAEAYIQCFTDHCTDFDAKAATTCLGTIKDASCSGGTDVQSCFSDVYTGCSTLELGACLATQAVGG